VPRDAEKRTVDLVRSRQDAIEHVDHDKRLWRRVYPPTGREGLVPLAFVVADTTEAKVANMVQALEEAGRRYWAPRRYQTLHRGITAKDYGQAVPVVVTTLEQLQQHGADAAVWRCLGGKAEQTLTAALDNPDGEERAEDGATDGPDSAAGRVFRAFDGGAADGGCLRHGCAASAAVIQPQQQPQGRDHPHCGRDCAHQVAAGREDPVSAHGVLEDSDPHDASHDEDPQRFGSDLKCHEGLRIRAPVSPTGPRLRAPCG
jgi:hypothetical protein